MKPRFANFVAALGLCISAGALASPIIELRDGSRVQGEIQSLENGSYTIVSPSMGTVRIPQSNIVRIIYDSSADRSVTATDSSVDTNHLLNQVMQMQSQLAQDPDAMQSILSLQSNPQIQALLNDPQIMQAIQQGDFAGLLNNPKIQALDGDAQLKQVLKQLGP